MAYYWTCPYCGSNNDPGEACDCRFEDIKKRGRPGATGTTSGTNTQSKFINERPQSQGVPEVRICLLN